MVMAVRLRHMTLCELLPFLGQQLELMLAMLLLVDKHFAMVFVANVRRNDGWWWWWWWCRRSWFRLRCPVKGEVSVGDLLLLEVDAVGVALRIRAAGYGFTFFGETEFFRLVDGRPVLEPTVFQCFVEIAVVVKGFLCAGGKKLG